MIPLDDLIRFAHGLELAQRCMRQHGKPVDHTAFGAHLLNGNRPIKIEQDEGKPGEDRVPGEDKVAHHIRQKDHKCSQCQPAHRSNVLLADKLDAQRQYQHQQRH
ncbi:hypothetical protein SDC9_137483 [bioreactor metagenome]|uniref:Uncharacterized protein n=1 Tax=bioreactor metagenome TaxID=1076179 RepID=A0A645DP90_9ZZZZ